MIRKFCFIIILLVFWNFTLFIFPFDLGYLTTFKFIININYNLYLFLWFIVCFLGILSFYNSFINYDLDSNYYFVYFINFIFTQIFGLFFFVFNDLILSIIISSIVFSSSCFLWYETKKIDKYFSYLTIPLVIFNFVNLISLFIIFALN